MTNIIVTVGKDVAAYAEVRVPQGTDLDNATLRQIALEADRNEVFTPNWENSNGLRIVCVSGSENSEDNNICDIQVESGRLDLGMEAELFLKGVISLDQFVSNAISLRTIKEEEVDLQPIDVYAEIVDGTISSVKTKSKHFNGAVVQIDHDNTDDAMHEFNGMEVDVSYLTIEKNAGDMSLLPITGSIERMLLNLKTYVETFGLSKKVEGCVSWYNIYEDKSEKILLEDAYASLYEDQCIVYNLAINRSDIGGESVMANCKVIHENGNISTVIYEQAIDVTNLVNKLIEQDII